jgi:hypothetical protein
MDHTPPSDLLTAALETIKRWDDAEYNKNAQLILEEQPYLMRFIMNLIDDMQEEDIEFLILALMGVQLGFKMRGIPLEIASADAIDVKVKALVKRYDAIDQKEEVSIDDIFETADNPQVIKQLFEVYYRDFIEGETIGMAEVMNLLLIIELIVSSVEGSTIETPKG